MKSRRVTKLLACVLAASMCAVPVYATTEPTTMLQKDGSGSIKLNFGKEDINVKVSVPTSAALKINPLTNAGGSMSTTVSNGEIASRDLRIINYTWAQVAGTTSENEGIPVIVTAQATVTNAAEDVRVLVDETRADNNDDFADDSEKKNVYMELQEGTLDDVSGNGTYGSGDTAVVTRLGSRIRFSVSGPSTVSSGASSTQAEKDAVSNTISDADAGLGAMAILGRATINAAWQSSDLDVGLVYNIQASKATVTAPTNQATVASGAITVTKAVLGDAEVDSVAIQDPKANAYGWFPLEFADDQIEVNAAGDWKLTIDPGVLAELAAEDSLKGANNPQDVVIKLTDGRVIISSLTVS